MPKSATPSQRPRNAVSTNDSAADAACPASRKEAFRIMRDNPKLQGEQGQALRALLYLFERDEAIPLLGAG